MLLEDNNNDTMMDMLPEAKQWWYNNGHAARGKTMIQWWTCCQRQNNNDTMMDMLPEAKQQWYNDGHAARGKTTMIHWRTCCHRLPKQVNIKQWASWWWSSLSSLRLRVLFFNQWLFGTGKFLRTVTVSKMSIHAQGSSYTFTLI